MLKSLSLKFGSKGTEDVLKFNLSPVTIFVGPNNSGKSLALMEIEGFLHSGNQPHFKILNEIETEIDNHEKFLHTVRGFEIIKETDNDIFYELVTSRGNYEQIKVNKNVTNDLNIKNHYCFERIIQFLTLRLDGRARLDLVNFASTSDLQGKPINRLMELFLNRQKRERIRSLIYDAFYVYFVIDPTDLKNFRIRLSKRLPVNISEEEGIDQIARQFHSEAKLVEEFSDGVKAYIGLLIALIAGSTKYFLVDEPEAFLHPPLAKKLGKELSVLINEIQGNLFIATHSSNFLMGCIQSGIPSNIVRLTYQDEKPKAKLLPSNTLYPLMYNPLLRSTGVLESLFYEYVIVTEADTDKAFYDEINYRLITFDKERGIESCLFLNAKNIQTVSDIVKPLREFGIPCAALTDIDVLKNGGDEWNKLLDACLIPLISHESLQRERSNLKKRFDELGLNMKKGGISLLPKSDKEACQNLFEQLASYGIFVVPNGELETWMQDLGVRGHGTDWLIDIFNKLGSDPAEPNYIKSQKGDVWDFIYSLKGWLEDSNRKGMPE